MAISRRTVLIAGLVGITSIMTGAHFWLNDSDRKGKKLRVGYVPLADFSPLKWAQDNGVFQRQGLTVELVKLQSGARILEGIASKTLDVGVTNLVTLLLARSRGIDFQIVSGASLEQVSAPLHGLVVNADSKIRSMGDLKGRRVAVNVLRSVNELVLAVQAEKNGFSVSDINFTEVPFPQMLGALTNQAVDAAIAVEPYVTQAVSQYGCRVISHHIVDTFGDTPVAAYVADRREAAGKAKEISAFRKGLEEASVYLNSASAKPREFIATFTGLNPDLVSKMNLPKFITNLEPTVADQMLSLMVKQQWISQESARSVRSGLLFPG